MIDAFGNKLSVGDYFSYAAQSYGGVGQRVGRVVAEGEKSKIACRWGNSWSLTTHGRPNDSVTRIPHDDIPQDLRDLLS